MGGAWGLGENIGMPRPGAPRPTNPQPGRAGGPAVMLPTAHTDDATRHQKEHTHTRHTGHTPHGRQTEWVGYREGPLLASDIGSFIATGEPRRHLEHKISLHKAASEVRYIVIFNNGSTTEPN
jgi:hypothetical protein